MSATLAIRPGTWNTAANQCRKGFVWKKKTFMCATRCLQHRFLRTSGEKYLKWNSNITKLQIRKLVPHQCAKCCGFSTDLINREKLRFYFNMLYKGTHLQLYSIYKVKWAVLHHRGYKTGFISAWMENMSKVEKGTIVFKTVSFISFKFIANIMDECLFWRLKVTQTCFLNKMSCRAKQKPHPFFPTTTHSTSQLPQSLHGCSRLLDLFVWCRLNSP